MGYTNGEPKPKLEVEKGEKGERGIGVDASSTWVGTCVGWPNGLASFLSSTRESQKTHFKADISSISLANNRLMDVTHLALTWVGWPNGERLASTCVQI